jgi:uncharacterized protein YjbI with pentapeptide repeats
MQQSAFWVSMAVGPLLVLALRRRGHAATWGPTLDLAAAFTWLGVLLASPYAIDAIDRHLAVSRDALRDTGTATLGGAVVAISLFWIERRIEELRSSQALIDAKHQRREELQLRLGMEVALSGKIFSGIDLSGIVLNRRELRGADFRDSTLTDASVEDADLTDAIMIGAQLHGLRARNATLINARLENANLTRANLTRAILTGATTTGRTLFLEANLGHAKMDHLFLTGCNLQGSDLSHAAMRRCNLRDADLGNATLVGTDLREADLRGASLEGADLTDADLRGADLRGTSRVGVDLTVCLRDSMTRLE